MQLRQYGLCLRLCVEHGLLLGGHLLAHGQLHDDVGGLGVGVELYETCLRACLQVAGCELAFIIRDCGRVCQEAKVAASLSVKLRHLADVHARRLYRAGLHALRHGLGLAVKLGLLLGDAERVVRLDGIIEDGIDQLAVRAHGVQRVAQPLRRDVALDVHVQVDHVHQPRRQCAEYEGILGLVRHQVEVVVLVQHNVADDGVGDFLYVLLRAFTRGADAEVGKRLYPRVGYVLEYLCAECLCRKHTGGLADAIEQYAHAALHGGLRCRVYRGLLLGIAFLDGLVVAVAVYPRAHYCRAEDTAKGGAAYV